MPLARAEEIRTRHAQIAADLEVLETAEDNDENRLRFEALTDEWDTLDVELKPLTEREAKLDQVRARMAEEGNRERGFGAPDLVMRTASDPYKDLDVDAVRTRSLSDVEISARAAAVIETHAKKGLLAEHDYAEAATALLDRARSDEYLQGGRKDGEFSVAQQILLTGTADYRDLFGQYLRNPMGYQARAAMSLTSANGGYLVPYTLDPTIILTNAGSANPWRQLAEVKTTTTNDANYVTSAGVNATWLGENTEAADSSPTVGTLKITPQKAAAWVYGSFEVLEDSDFAQQFPTLMADAKDRLEEAAFATGAGSGGVPKGLITAATTTVTSATVANYAAADIYSVEAALPARWRGPRARLAWAGNLTQILKAKQFPKFTGATDSIVSVEGGQLFLDGIPLLESTTMSATLTTGQKVLVYGDMSQFYIVDRIGMSVLYEPNVKGTGSGFPKGAAGWFAFWRVGSDITTPQAFRVLVTQ